MNETKLQIEPAVDVAAPVGNAWLTVAEAAKFERITEREVYRRMMPGDPHFLISRGRGQERRIYARSMSFDAQRRWRERALTEAAEPKVAAAAPAARGQLDLLPREGIDHKIAALSLPKSEKEVVIRRFRIAEQMLNHNWKAEGHRTKRDFKKALAKANCTSVATIDRITAAYKESGGDLLALARERRGPERGTGSDLDADMRAHLQDCWTIKKLTIRQSHDSLVRYLTAKQQRPGCRVDHLYKIPKYHTVARFIRSLDSLDKAARQGPEALRAACGYIPRTYRDLKSLERVETDEWKCDFLAYLSGRPANVTRFFVFTFYDERSIYPLCWKLVEGDKFDKRHGIKEGDEIELLTRLLCEYGVPGALVSDRGRFRGGTFGALDKFKNSDGILDRLGIAHNVPREKNPRGDRLERFHRYLADQSRTVPGWIGANVKERETAPGDAQAALHMRWCAGDPQVLTTPLLSTIQLLVKINEWMEAWRAHASEGTDMDGLSPRAVFVHNTPAEGFRRVPDKEIAFATAEHFELTIPESGVIKLRDGKRYSHPSLALIAGQRREMVRLRDDHSRLSVLPAEKGEEKIIAPLCVPVGTNDPENLAAGMALIQRTRKIAGEAVKPQGYAEAIDISNFVEVPEPEKKADEPKPDPPYEEISGIAYWMENEERQAARVKPLDFADIEH